MKKIIITGGLGYIGMELSKIYSGKTRNYEVTVIDRNFFSERVSQLKRWGIKYKQIDILNKDELRNIISDADIIYHLAGITDVGTTKEDKDKKRDKEIREVGVVGTKNIINFSNEMFVYIIVKDLEGGDDIIVAFPNSGDWHAQPLGDPFLDELEKEFKNLEDYLKSKQSDVIEKQY